MCVWTALRARSLGFNYNLYSGPFFNFEISLFVVEIKSNTRNIDAFYRILFEAVPDAERDFKIHVKQKQKLYLTFITVI